MNRGNAAYRAQDFTSAVDLYTQLLRVKPGDPRIFYNRGNAYYELGDLQRALADFGEALKIDPDFHLALVNRGNVYARLGRLAEAITDLDRAAVLKPGEQRVFYNRGVAYERLGDYAQAVDDLSEAIRLNPADAQSYVARGMALSALGKSTAARDDFTVALKFDPGNAAAARRLEDLTGKQETMQATAGADISRAGDDTEYERATSSLLDLADEACLQSGEDTGKLNAVATSRALVPSFGESPDRGSRKGAVRIGGWTSTAGYGTLSIHQSRIAGTPPLFVCAITAELQNAHAHPDFPSAFEQRFNTSALEARVESASVVNRYWLPHTATCDVKTSLISSGDGSMLTISMTHGRKRAANAD